MLVRRGQRPVSFEWDRSVSRAKTGTLERALRDTVTISGRTSVFVPLLLQPALTEGVVRVYSAKGIVSSRPNQVMPHGDVILYGIQSIDGVDAFKVELTDGAEPNILWIDVRSYLIRRISRNLTVFGSKPGLRWKETITYHPQLNGPVSVAALAFQPGPELTDWQRWVRLLPGNGGLLLPGNESLLLIVALLATLVALLANRLHRQQLRRRGQEVRESWFIPARRLTFVGAMGIGAICFGMWLAGVDRADIWRNLLMAPLLQQAFFLLYVMHRRSRDHARLTTAA